MKPMVVFPNQIDHIDLTSDSIERLEREFMKLEQVECAVVHSFAPGQYIRQVVLPAGAIVIGHHQNYPHLNVMVRGRVSMRNDDGTFSEVKAPQVFVGKPGRKIGFIHEEVQWLNIYSTDETDVETLESLLLTKSDAWLESAEAQSSVIQLQSAVDRRDFERLLVEMNLTAEQVRAQSENENDRTELPYGSYRIKVADSKVEGKGLFATGDILEGEVIAPARIGGKRTIAGRFTNHSLNPNARMVRSSLSDIDLVAIRKITGCHGGLDGEEITVNYRESVRLTLEIGK